jgi:uncharacterized membrane protein
MITKTTSETVKFTWKQWILLYVLMSATVAVVFYFKATLAFLIFFGLGVLALWTDIMELCIMRGRIRGLRREIAEVDKKTAELKALNAEMQEMISSAGGNPEPKGYHSSEF